MANLAQAIANLTNKFNQFIANAKKVDELEPQPVLNSSSKFHVMLDGVSQYLTVQQILDAFIEKTFKELVSVGSISLDEEEITFTDIIWKIEDVSYTKTDQIDIPLALEGNIRNDIFVGNNMGQIERIAGIESDSIAITPQTPFNKVFITQVSVTDSTVEDPTPPNTGTLYVEKEERLAQKLTSNGIVGITGVSTKKSRLILATPGTVSQLSGISKINANTKHEGQLFAVENRQTVSTLLKNNDVSAGSGTKFWFYDGKDLVLLSGQIAFFQWDLENDLLRFVFVSQKPFEVSDRIGAVIKFDNVATYGTPTTPITGNITFDFTNAKKGMIQQMYHQGATVPTMPASAFILNSSAYDTSHKNMILFCFSVAGRVEVSFNSMS